MSEPARQLQQVGEATRAMRGVADQALEWVRVSEERVVAAEKRADEVKGQVKERALLTLRKVTAEAREKIAAERAARAATAEAENAVATARAAAEKTIADERQAAGEDFKERLEEARQQIQAEA